MTNAFKMPGVMPAFLATPTAFTASSPTNCAICSLLGAWGGSTFNARRPSFSCCIANRPWNVSLSLVAAR
jgi:hypothetical protein